MWLFENKEFTSEQIQNYVAFVYLITNTVNGRKYIGKKLFTKSKSYVIKKKKKKKRVESDWKNYYGSSAELQNDIDLYGKDSFDRKILRLCSSKSEANYFELREQMMNDVLLRSDYYNSFAGTRIHKKHLAHLLKSAPDDDSDFCNS